MQIILTHAVVSTDLCHGRVNIGFLYLLAIKKIPLRGGKTKFLYFLNFQVWVAFKFLCKGQKTAGGGEKNSFNEKYYMT